MKFIKVNSKLFKKIKFKLTLFTFECSCGKKVLDTPSHRLQSLLNNK